MKVNDVIDKQLEGYIPSDEKDEWGALKVKVKIDGLDSLTLRRIRTYVAGFSRGWSFLDSSSGYIYLYNTWYSIKPCPKGEYKLEMELLNELISDLKALFPVVTGEFKVYKKYYKF